MITWFNIYNEATFEAEDLVSKELTDIVLGDLGSKDILITKGNTTGIVIDGVFLACGLNDKNPFRMGDFLAYVDDDDEIWLGVWSED